MNLTSAFMYTTGAALLVVAVGAQHLPQSIIGPFVTSEKARMEQANRLLQLHTINAFERHSQATGPDKLVTKPDFCFDVAQYTVDSRDTIVPRMEIDFFSAANSLLLLDKNYALSDRSADVEGFLEQVDFSRQLLNDIMNGCAISLALTPTT